ncbi:MAG: hypothetical protein NZ610_01340 [Candidatus Bipolaricaulota bacterium]|nr:hypothetical protein [Candidatus Bipolaricaulota bacterium]MCS7274037.1 hypothetical protein [Candidatus Bipolaricaulota bacterium]MDW8110237.1 hypothetical protein [Candidatus Bipolaricaulota bacterium]MDW8328863.1 hypothetical protein [Candidatus Bipolaricaulota bacterium]
MRRALFLSYLLVFLVSARALAQSTLTFATVFPFDSAQLKPPYAEIVLKRHRAPLTLSLSALLTPQGWRETKFSSEYKAPELETTVKADFTPHQLRSAETKWKLIPNSWLAVEGDLQMSVGHFKSSAVKLKFGPSDLNLTSSAKFAPTGLMDERVALNVSRSLELGNLEGSTLFDRHGFREQTLTVSGSLSEWATLSLTATLKRQGLASQAIELGLSWELWSVSASVTVTSRGLESESLSLDGMLAGLLLQVSLESSNLAWRSLQIMALGSLDALLVNALIMLSSDSLQMITLDLSWSLWGWQTQLKLDLMGSDLSDLDLQSEITMGGRLWGLAIESALSLRFYELVSASVRLQRTLSRWTGRLELEFSADGFSNGSFTLERRLF